MRFHTTHHIYKFAVRKKVFEKIFFLKKSQMQPLMRVGMTKGCDSLASMWHWKFLILQDYQHIWTGGSILVGRLSLNIHSMIVLSTCIYVWENLSHSLLVTCIVTVANDSIDILGATEPPVGIYFSHWQGNSTKVSTCCYNWGSFCCMCSDRDMWGCMPLK